MTTLEELRAVYKRAQELAAESLDWARRVILPGLGATLREFPAPMGATPNAVYAGGESFGRRGAITKYPEAGRWMATCKKGIDDEVGLFNFNPFDTYSSVWGAQWSWVDARKCAERALAAAGYSSFGSQHDIDKIVLLFLVRSIGTGALRRLLVRAARSTPGVSPGCALNDLCWKTGIDLHQGQQTDSVVRLRVWKALAQSTFGALCQGEVWDFCAPGPARNALIRPAPSGIYTQLASLSRAAHRGGPKWTGPWPGRIT
jgi:hypothetical protein